nr:DUF1778 domain-containing protein [uncultured Rhodopila sp.]
MPASNPLLRIHVTPTERDLLRAAAEHARTNLSDFVRRKAIKAAEMDLADRLVVTIPAEDWAKLERCIRAPAKPNAALRDLAANRPLWQDSLRLARRSTAEGRNQ